MTAFLTPTIYLFSTAKTRKQHCHSELTNSLPHKQHATFFAYSNVGLSPLQS